MSSDGTLGRIAWIDIETDGILEAGKEPPLLLEFAVTLTDGNLNELGSYSAVIRYVPRLIQALEPCDVVREMHVANGLWQDLLDEEKTVPREEVEARAIELILAHPDPEGRQVLWAGCSPGALDRPLLQAEMPKLCELFGHRTLDLTSIKSALQNWAGVAIPKCSDLHRAAGDVEEMIALCRKFRRELGFVLADKHYRSDLCMHCNKAVGKLIGAWACKPCFVQVHTEGPEPLTELEARQFWEAGEWGGRKEAHAGARA